MVGCDQSLHELVERNLVGLVDEVRSLQAGELEHHALGELAGAVHDRNDPLFHLGCDGELAFDRRRLHRIGREDQHDRTGVADALDDGPAPAVLVVGREVVGVEPWIDTARREVIRKTSHEGGVPP